MEEIASVIKYWEAGSYYRQPNNQTLLPISREEAKTGNVLLELPTAGVYQLWVAPFVFFNHAQSFYVPLLLPACYKQGKLELSDPPLLPWVDTAVSLAEQDFIDWCLNSFFDENQTCLFTQWEDFYEASYALLNQTVDWQALLESKGWKLLPQSAYFWQLPVSKRFSPLLMRYATIETLPPIGLKEMMENTHLFCGENPEKPFLSRNDYETVIQALMLPKENCLTIETPWGANKEAVIDAIASSKLIYAAVQGYPLPEIYLLAPTKENRNISCQPCVIDALIDLYQNMLSGLHLVEKMLIAKEKEEYLDEEIAFLQSQDEKAEKRLGIILQAQQKAVKNKKTIKQKWQQWFRKKACPFDAAIRKVNLKRAKNHQVLLELIEQKAIYKQAEEYWKEWCQIQGITDPSKAQQIMATKMFSTVGGGWKKIQHFSHLGFSLYQWKTELKSSRGERLLIVEEAHRLSAVNMLPFLQKMDHAIFMGDPQEYFRGRHLDPITDQQLLLAHELFNEDFYDDLHYKGMLLSTGNAWQIAFCNRAYEKPCLLNDVEPRHPSLIAYCNTFHEGKLISQPLEEKNPGEEGLRFLPVKSHSHPQNNQRVNPIEAKVIYDNLLAFGNKFSSETLIIVALYQAQVLLLQRVLRSTYPEIKIYTYDKLPDRCWDTIIFSTVLTSRDPRPYLFDRNDTFFYSLAVRARRGLWIVGDEALYDPKMHSPSGKLAKFFMSHNVPEQQEALHYLPT